MITAIVIAFITIGATAYITQRQGGEEVRRQEKVAAIAGQPIKVVLLLCCLAIVFLFVLYGYTNNDELTIRWMRDPHQYSGRTCRRDIGNPPFCPEDKPYTLEYIVIHTTQGSTAEGAIQEFKNREDKSIHYIIPEGPDLQFRIIQMVKDEDTAWHVGVWPSESNWSPKGPIHHFNTIGIEHIGFPQCEGWYGRVIKVNGREQVECLPPSPDKNLLRHEVYKASAILVRDITGRWGIPRDRSHIKGHNEAPGATHTDPGPYWDWKYYMNLVQGRPGIPDHTLIRAKDRDEIFWYQNGKRYLILDRDIIKKMSGLPSWNPEQVEEFLKGTLDFFPQGPDFIAPDSRSDGLLIQQQDIDPVIFLVENGVRKYISPEEFEARGYDENDVIGVTRKIIELIPLDPSIPHLTLQEAVARGFVELESKGGYFGDKVTFISNGNNTRDVGVKVRKGDIFLSKTEDQDLIAIKDLEIYIPAGKTVRLGGIWVACLDPGRSPPSLGDKLDVSVNLRDWIYESAVALLKLLEEHEGAITQEAVWEITRREDFPELSNPNSSSSDTGVALPPELSMLWLIARHIEACPEGAEDPDKIICRKEIEFTAWLYLTGQTVPGTSDKKIDLKSLREMVSFYITKTPIDRPPSGASGQEVEAQLASLLREGQGPGKRLKVTEVLAIPNPVGSTGKVEFKAEGTGIESIELEIFDLSGRRVFDSGEVLGKTFEWHLLNNEGKVVANGVYLYLVTVEGFNRELLKSPVKKMVILR